LKMRKIKLQDDWLALVIGLLLILLIFIGLLKGVPW